MEPIVTGSKSAMHEDPWTSAAIQDTGKALEPEVKAELAIPADQRAIIIVGFPRAIR